VRVRLTPREPAVLHPGDWIRLPAVLRPPPGPAAPGAFDFARQAYFARLGAVGYAVGHVARLTGAEAAPAPADDGRRGWRLWWSGLRDSVARRILDVLPDRRGAVAAALMTGERGAIPEAVTKAMRDSGLAHLLAISGLHMGLVAGLLFFGLRALLALVPGLALDHPIKKWAAVAAGLGGFVYLLLTGATVPTQRAFVMVLLVLLAVLVDRRAISLRLVAWAALAVLLLAPESLLSASFQMSFAAVTALVAGYELVARRGWVGQRGLPVRLGLYLAGVALTSVIAILATAPFAVFHFNRMALYGLAANLAAVPLTAFWIMPWAVVAFLLMPFGLAAAALVPMGWGIAALLSVAEFIAGLPGAVLAVKAMPSAGLGLVVLGGLWLCLWARPWRRLGAVPIAAGLACLLLSAPPDVLVSGDGKLLAVREPDGTLWLSSKQRGRFTAETWLRRAGQVEGRAWSYAAERGDSPLLCDQIGCIYRAGQEVVALALDGRALAEDCRAATVLISLEPLRRRRCPGPKLVIDRFDLWRNGGHALWLSAGGVRVESVATGRGTRPWVGRPR
jgi:competence protein ComEC